MSRQVGNPSVVGNGGLAVGAAHLLEQWRGGWIVTNVVKSLDAGMAFHVRLAGEDENFKFFGLCRGRERQQQERCDER